MKTLALIYASEGTGHKSAAFALREAFLAANPDGNALCLDILDFVPPFMKGLLSGGYDVMARSAPWLWSRFYWGSDKRGGQASAFEWVHGQFCRACLPKLRRHLAATSPPREAARWRRGIWKVGGLPPAYPCLAPGNREDGNTKKTRKNRNENRVATDRLSARYGSWREKCGNEPT